MSFLDFFKKKRTPSPMQNAGSKEEFFRMVLEQMCQKTPSEHFASGAIFDIVRKDHSSFEQLVRSKNPVALQNFFVNAYLLFCKNPEIVGLTPAMVDIKKNDTDPLTWNADIITSSSGEAIALCYMPIQHQTLEARIIGIVIGSECDRYYYCMLNKDINMLSDVMQNKVMLGVEKVGEIKGRGFDLMNSFVVCMNKNS